LSYLEIEKALLFLSLYKKASLRREKSIFVFAFPFYLPNIVCILVRDA